MGKLDEKRQTLLLCVAGVLVVLLFPGRWAWDSIQSTRDEVATVEAETIELEDRARAGEAVANRIDEWKVRLEAVQAAIPTHEGFEEVNLLVAAAAREAGVNWRTGRPTVPTTNTQDSRSIGGAKLYAFGLGEISGQPIQVNDFLTKLASLKRAVVIDQVDWQEEIVNGASTVRADVKIGYLAGGTVVAPEVEK